MSEDVMDIAETIKSKYGNVATQAARGAKASCCGGDNSCNPVTNDLYSNGEVSALPVEAVLASQGCGNPTALAELKSGEVVLDLGSGGGIDVLLSARRVGPAGKAYGLDMTDEMLALARENQRKAGVENVEFRRGEIEHIPLPDNSVDVVISNCVINLSADKRRVLAETYRVLKPGGRFAVSDVVAQGELPANLRADLEAWVGCVAGALEEGEFRALLGEVGFVDADVEPTRVYRSEDARAFLTEGGLDVDATVDEIDGKFMAAFVRATKPATSAKPGACCGPDCCP
jgi:SAM-dependent methyltransferase